MVLPVYTNKFQVGKSKEDLKSVADVETMAVSIDNGIEEWSPFDTKGWTRRLMTAKSISVSLTAKRNIGDAGNDYLAGLAFTNGTDSNGFFSWTMADGKTKVEFNAVISVTSLAGDSTAVDGMEIEILSDGAPVITQEPAAAASDMVK